MDEKIKLMQEASRRLSCLQYDGTKTLHDMFVKRLSIYTDVGLDDITILTTEIGFLWEFVDKGLGSAVGYAGLLDETLKKGDNK